MSDNSLPTAFPTRQAGAIEGRSRTGRGAGMTHGLQIIIVQHAPAPLEINPTIMPV